MVISASGVVNLRRNNSVLETADRLEALLRTKGLKVFAPIVAASEMAEFKEAWHLIRGAAPGDA